jgi:hypothetical protein
MSTPTSSVAESQKAVASKATKSKDTVVGKTEDNESRYPEPSFDPAEDTTFHVENFYDPNTGELIQGRLGDGTYVDNRKDK